MCVLERENSSQSRLMMGPPNDGEKMGNGSQESSSAHSDGKTGHTNGDILDFFLNRYRGQMAPLRGHICLLASSNDQRRCLLPAIIRARGAASVNNHSAGSPGRRFTQTCSLRTLAQRAVSTACVGALRPLQSWPWTLSKL